LKSFTFLDDCRKAIFAGVFLVTAFLGFLSITFLGFFATVAIFLGLVAADVEGISSLGITVLTFFLV